MSMNHTQSPKAMCIALKEDCLKIITMTVTGTNGQGIL
jgi:hypothetical protein